MPGLVGSLGVDDSRAASLDWATVAVFTCAASCSPPDKGYAPEALIKQDYA